MNEASTGIRQRRFVIMNERELKSTLSWVALAVVAYVGIRLFPDLVRYIKIERISSNS
jgi:hypothetical protein